MCIRDSAQPLLGQAISHLEGGSGHLPVADDQHIMAFRMAQDVHAPHMTFGRDRVGQLVLGIADDGRGVVDLQRLVQGVMPVSYTHLSHAVELNALVFATPDTGDVRGAALLARRARQWASHHKLPITMACADGSGNSVAAAMMSLRDQGRRAIAVGSFFLTADDNYLACLLYTSG